MSRNKPAFIHIKGARTNNLKNIEVKIPKNQLVVMTGVSGSGKSSLAFDTLYAEGQRRYVESLSSYARQFLNRMKKPDVDFIRGICPAIAIEQKVSTANARSTVGSLTEIYDYIRLLFARVGKTISPVSGNPVKKHTVTDVVEFIHQQGKESKIQLIVPLNQHYPDRMVQQELELLLQKGYTRIYYQSELHDLQDLLEEHPDWMQQTISEIDTEKVNILIDRFLVKPDDEENKKRIADSVGTAFHESGGMCTVLFPNEERTSFNNRFELDGLVFVEPSPSLFNYNNPYGACPRCEGFGRVMGIDPAKVIPNPRLSVYEGAVQCWKGEKASSYLNRLIENAHRFDFPIHTPYYDLTEEEKEVLWTGNQFFYGINDFFEHLREKSYKIQNRVMMARYRGRSQCPQCKGTRLRKEAMYVQVAGKTIRDIIFLPLDELNEFFLDISLTTHEQQIASRILLEIRTRLKNLCDLGLGYLHLDRTSSTLSGGETQRINLTKSIGSNLTNSLYILDEPSIGLHPRDTEKLIVVLQKLRDLGNTVLIVEHEEEVIKKADYLIDIGPFAGIYGGEVVFAGPYEQATSNGHSTLTIDYLKGTKSIHPKEEPRTWNNRIELKGVTMHNLKLLDITIPIHALTVVSGVSGSGKSTLVHEVLYKALAIELNQNLPKGSRSVQSAYQELSGDLQVVSQVEMISQNPIGKSSRSNPITYVKAYDSIRKLMADQQLSKIRGFKPKHFSFNVDGGRCDTCKGDGEIVIEMQFLADVKLTCEDCQGKRFKPEVLDVQFQGKNIHQILQLSVDEAIDFFANQKDIVNKIQPLQNVGLGYIQLGQSSSTLSGGEAQRVKLAFYLGKERSSEHILFIFDEPTTGLHFHDIRKLLHAFDSLIEKGHTIVVVEHNLDVIKNADWVIDLGPGGGKHGGQILYQGPGPNLKSAKQSVTAQYL